MKISLIMGTLNRRELMVRAIQSVLDQEHNDFEIIIVDQSQEKYPEIENIDDRIKYIAIEEKGLSLARNIGISHATGEIIGFMDDDAVYDTDSLTIADKLFKDDRDLYLVSGVIVDPKEKETYIRRNSCVKITWANFMKTCMSAAIFIRGEFFQEHSFDEFLGVGRYLGSAEESDIVAQLLMEGYKAVHASNLIIYHVISRGKELIQLEKHKSYCRGFGAFCAKHIYKYNNIHIDILYKRKMFRTWCGFIVSRLKRDKKLQSLYGTTLESRREGYRIYKEKICNCGISI